MSRGNPGNGPIRPTDEDPDSATSAVPPWRTSVRGWSRAWWSDRLAIGVVCSCRSGRGAGGCIGCRLAHLARTARWRGDDRRRERVGRIHRDLQRVIGRRRPGRIGDGLRDVERLDSDAQADLVGAAAGRASPPADRQLSRSVRGWCRWDVQRRAIGDGRVHCPAHARGDGHRFAQLGRCRVGLRRDTSRVSAPCRFEPRAAARRGPGQWHGHE